MARRRRWRWFRVAGLISLPALAALFLFVFLRGPMKFTMILLPDTQYYAEARPDLLQDQVDWILDQAQPRNIVFVLQAGDLVEHFDSAAEWQVVDTAFRQLEGQVPFSVLPGNHDMSPERNPYFYNRVFPSSRFERRTWYGGSYPPGTNNNNYEIFSAGGYDLGPFSVAPDRFLILNLEFCPTPDVVAWADNVLSQHADRHAIILTHAYLNVQGGRNIHQPSGGCTAPAENTRYLFDQLIYPHLNVFLVLSGHEYDTQNLDGEEDRIDLNAAGRPVYQLTSDFQRRPGGGGGWLRILGFNRKLSQVIVRTYSPSLGSYEKDGDSEFILPFPGLPDGPALPQPVASPSP